MFYFFLSFFANNLPSTRASKKLANHAANIVCFFFVCIITLFIIYSTTGVYVSVCFVALFILFVRWVTQFIRYNTVLSLPTSLSPASAHPALSQGEGQGFRGLASFAQNLPKSSKFALSTLNALTLGLFCFSVL